MQKEYQRQGELQRRNFGLALLASSALHSPLLYGLVNPLDKEHFVDKIEADFRDGTLDSMSYREFFLRSEAIEAQNLQLFKDAKKAYERAGTIDPTDFGFHAEEESYLSHLLVFGLGNCEARAKLEVSKYQDEGDPNLAQRYDAEPNIQFLNTLKNGVLVPHTRVIYATENGFTSFETETVMIENSIVAPKEIFVAGYLKEQGRSYPHKFDAYFFGVDEFKKDSLQFVERKTNSFLQLPTSFDIYEQREKEEDYSIQSKRIDRILATTPGFGEAIPISLLDNNGTATKALFFIPNTINLGQELIGLSQDPLHKNKNYSLLADAERVLNANIDPTSATQATNLLRYAETEKASLEDFVKEQMKEDLLLGKFDYPRSNVSRYLREKIQKKDPEVIPLVLETVRRWDHKTPPQTANQLMSQIVWDSTLSDVIINYKDMLSTETMVELINAIDNNAIIIEMAKNKNVKIPDKVYGTINPSKATLLRAGELWGRGDFVSALQFAAREEEDCRLIISERNGFPDFVEALKKGDDKLRLYLEQQIINQPLREVHIKYQWCGELVSRILKEAGLYGEKEE